MDMDKDGDLDLITAAMGEYYLNWWENDGSQNFTKHSFPGYCYGGFGFAIKDIDGDHINDIAAVGFSSNRLIWLENTCPQSINDNPSIQTGFKLNQNYPNPFNPATTINYYLQKTGKVELAIYNIVGQKVKTLVESMQTSGEHQVKWNGKDEHGHLVPSGIYLYKIKAGENIQAKKMILLK